MDAKERGISGLDLSQIFPTEITFKILGLLYVVAVCQCRQLSRKWRDQVTEYLRTVLCLDFAPYESILTENGLKHLLMYTSNLRVLHLDSCWPCVTEENLFLIAKNCKKLSVLTTSRCKGVTDAGLEAVSRHCKELTELDLSSCFTISDAGVIALGERCSAIRELHVSSCYGVTDKSIGVLAKQSCGLTELDVSWCFYVTDQSIKEFLSPSCKLELLRIKGCTVSEGLISKLMAKGIVVNNFF